MSKQQNGTKRLIIKSDDINSDEHLSGISLSEDIKKLIVLSIAVILLMFIVVMFHYDFVNKPVTLARFLDESLVRFSSLGKMLSGQPSGGLSFSIYTILIVALVGAALAVCGAACQGIFKNPMASPSMLGVQSGGMVAAAFYLLLRWETSEASEFFTFEEYSALLDSLSFYDIYARQIWMIIGSLAGAGIIIALSTRAGRGKMSSVILIISGVLFSSFANTFTSLVRYWFIYNDPTPDRAYAMMSISMGSFANTYKLLHLVMLAVPILLCFALLFPQSGRFDLLMLGDDEAKTLGLNVRRFKTLIIILCTVLSAMILSFCGQIGFVGLLAPHFARRIARSNYKMLLSFSALSGALIMVLVYGVAACTGMTSSINVIISVVGGTVFMFIMLRYRRRRNADWA